MSQPFFWGIGFSFLHFLSVIIAMKCLKKIAPVLIHAASALFSLILLRTASAMIEFELWIAFSILAFCTSSYLFVFGTIYKSLTLRMLCEAQLHGGTISIDELCVLVTFPTFAARMSLLEKMERVSVEKNRYFMTRKGERTAMIFIALRKFFNIDTKAIYASCETRNIMTEKVK